jgi:cupin 2 domain-containing protein
MTQIRNLLENLPPVSAGEALQPLLHCRNLVIERIVSAPGVTTALYDQHQDEWVLLLQGAARLELEGRALDLKAGDALFIPARTPHRVLDTSAQPLCIWLAVHIHQDEAAALRAVHGIVILPS